jgi:hypothetical protein
MEQGTLFWKKNLNQVFGVLVFFGVAMILIYLVFQGIRMQNLFFENTWIFRMFDIGHEVNVPTFFSVVLFFILSACALICGMYDRFLQKLKKDWTPWIFISVLLLFLSFDELAQVHEQLTYHTQNVLGGVSGLFYFAWVIPYGIILLLISFYLIPFLLKLSTTTKYTIIGGALVFVLGAIGMEMIGARFYEIGGVYHPGFIIGSSLEEFMEITGLLIAVWGLFQEVHIRLDQKIYR